MMRILKINPRSLTSHRWSIVIGNLLEHFDSSLYGFLAPCVGKAFFPSYSPLYQLILTYGVYIITFVARPLGGLFFSHLTYRYGPLKALSWSLVGLALPTGLLGFIPSAHQIGILAPCLLILIRFAQSFCAAGESAIAGYYLIEDTSQSKQISWSGIYQSSTILGILMASSLSGLIFAYSQNEDLWRFAFLLGFILGLSGLWLRFPFQKKEIQGLSFETFPGDERTFSRLRTHWKLILFLVPVYGFSYLTYSVPFIFLNPYLEQITPISLATLLYQTSSLLWIDALLLPGVAFFTQRFSSVKTLLGSSLLFAAGASTLLISLPYGSLLMIFLLRLMMVIGGGGFLSALLPWTTRLYPPRDKYLLHSVSYNLGTELFGRSSPAICLWLYAVTQHPSSPLIYILALTLTSLSLIIWFEVSQRPRNRGVCAKPRGICQGRFKSAEFEKKYEASYQLSRCNTWR
ncbi:MAG TPA: hypothetical protein DEP85_01380 [Holosporales bacterium]|nr:hypothetical protein [Holosporales bacterium]